MEIICKFTKNLRNISLFKKGKKEIAYLLFFI